MSQNTSSAVMQQRVEAHDSLDDFPTQPWATRALCEHVLKPKVGTLSTMKAWEPACNRGHMSKPLTEYFHKVYSSDIHNYGWPGQHSTCDFLWHGTGSPFSADGGTDFIVSNPPFRLALEFIQKAREIATVGVAMIVRTAFLESVGRYEALFQYSPPSIIAQFTERVPMVKGRLTATGSTATAYCWLVWISGERKCAFTWIPPCRKKLERAGDYE